jgi:hypothetical protein
MNAEDHEFILSITGIDITPEAEIVASLSSRNIWSWG